MERKKQFHITFWTLGYVNGMGSGVIVEIPGTVNEHNTFPTPFPFRLFSNQAYFVRVNDGGETQPLLITLRYIRELG